MSEQSSKNWAFILFFSFLALVMIASSHSADKKVHRISKLNAQVKELKSEYVDTRMRLAQSKMESRIISTMEPMGLLPSSTPPKRIRIVKIQPEQYAEETRLATAE